MSLVLLAPLGLAALAALALPILIHLARRSELTVTDFAALRWVSERLRPRRRVRIERPWLLLLRLLLLTLLALLLARPVWLRDSAAPAAYVVVAPGVDRDTARSAAAASGAEWHWLTPGFPSLDGGPPAASDLPLASLLRELDAALPASTPLGVVVPQQLAGLDGERLRLAHAIDWHVVAGAMPAQAGVDAPSRARRLSVRYANANDPALKYLRAAVAAWNTRGSGRYTLDAGPLDVGSLDAAIPADADWLIWLGGALSPAATAWVQRGGTALIVNDSDARGARLWRTAAGAVVARETASGEGRILSLAGALTPAALPMLLDGDFPDRLRLALTGAPLPPTRATAAAAQPLHDATLAADPPRDPGHAQTADGLLVALIALLFAVERLVATWRRDEAT